MIPSTDHAQQILERSIANVQTLFQRNWPDIAVRLEEEEEVTLSYKVKITLRAGEPGQHADKDHRVQTTISFAKRFSDTTESALEDPNQRELPLDTEQSPESKLRYQLNEEIEGAILEIDNEEALHVRFERVRQFDPVTYGADDSFARFVEAIREIIAARSAPEGGDIEAGQGQTSIGKKLDAAAIETPNALIDMKLPSLPLKTAFAFSREFKKAAKKAGWPEAQIKLAFDQLESLDSPAEKLAFISAHVKRDETAPGGEAELPTKLFGVVIGGAALHLVPVKLETGFGAERLRMQFAKEANVTGWPVGAISEVDSHCFTINEQAGDAHVDAESATLEYLSGFCCEPV